MKNKHKTVTAVETIDFITKGNIYKLIETESIGVYIIDETGNEAYYLRKSILFND